MILLRTSTLIKKYTKIFAKPFFENYDQSSFFQQRVTLRWPSWENFKVMLMKNGGQISLLQMSHSSCVCLIYSSLMLNYFGFRTFRKFLVARLQCSEYRVYFVTLFYIFYIFRVLGPAQSIAWLAILFYLIDQHE